MTEIMPVPRKMRITVLPAGGVRAPFLYAINSLSILQKYAFFFMSEMIECTQIFISARMVPV